MFTASDIDLPDIPEGPVLVAVSGGADSVALLNILNRLFAKAAHPLVAAHFHHGIRGPEADRDEDSVRQMAERLGMRFVSGMADIPSVAAETGESLEMAARRLRHEFLQQTAQAERCVAIATGHTADDQIETLFLRLARGTSLRGAGGMRPVTQISGGVPIIRPLINLRHAQLCEWLVAESIPWREDATNADVSIQRNKVRHVMIPAFENAMGAQAVDSALRSMSMLRDDALLLDSLAAEKARDCSAPDGSLFVPALQSQPPPIFRRIVTDWLYNAGIDPEHVTLASITRLEKLCSGPEHGTVEAPLGGGWLAHRCNGIVSIFPPTPSGLEGEVDAASGYSFTLPTSDAQFGPIRLSPGGACFILRVSVSTRCVKPKRSSPLAMPVSCSLSTSLLSQRLTLRAPLPGDRISPVGSGITQKISDILTNLKIPRDSRGNVPLLALDDNHVIWLPGYAVDASAASGEHEKSYTLTLELSVSAIQ